MSFVILYLVRAKKTQGYVHWYFEKKKFYKYYGRVEDIPYEFQSPAKNPRLEPSTSTPCPQNSAFSTASFREPCPSVHLRAMDHCIFKLFR
ncbi:hypothetical protein B9Z55_027680 [Caenorhabditis nigoni]|uniref:Uncharacterized protein n=1 Tax=Caenorhabditis nigoni TaxID=1611254 RepID=A0A2G5SEU6_9PELO|nr:hypothetical protein B9Z55_027680 [Caenorhabditis nigoni]